jgi:hypothetical protein
LYCNAKYIVLRRNNQIEKVSIGKKIRGLYRWINPNAESSQDGNADSQKCRAEGTETRQCKEIGWYQIELNGEKAFVSNGYIVSVKPAATTAKQGNMSSSLNRSHSQI